MWLAWKSLQPAMLYNTRIQIHSLLTIAQPPTKDVVLSPLVRGTTSLDFAVHHASV